MIAPASTLPLAANDRPSRLPYFATKDGAEFAARRLARAESPTGAIERPAYVSGMFRAIEGGAAYEVRLLPFGDFEVRTVTEHELVRRQQAGMRGEVVRQVERAEQWEVDAAKARKGGAVQTEFLRHARVCRETAREIELQLTLAGVRKIGAEPVTSSELDSRHTWAR